MKKCLLYIVMLLYSGLSFSQGNDFVIDSLKQQLKTEKNADNKIIIAAKLFDKIYLNVKEKDSAFKYIKLAEEFINTSTNDSLKVLLNIGKIQYFQVKSKYDSVIYYAENVLKHREKIPVGKLIGLYNDVGLASYHSADYTKALKFHFKALKMCDSLEASQRKPQVLNNIGITYIVLKDWDRAETYMQKSLALCKELNIERGIIYTLGNLGIIYRNQNKYDEAIASYFESLSISESLNDKVAVIRNYLNIGALYESKKEFNNALSVYDKALKMVKDINHKQLESRILLNLGTVYSKQKRFNLADENFNLSMQISKQNKLLEVIVENHLNRAESYENRGNYKQAIKERKLYKTLHDSILNNEHLSNITELEIKYETEKKDKELVEQHLAIEKKELQLQQKQSQFKLMSGLALALLLTSVLIWFLYLQRQKRKNQEILTLKREQQVKTLENLMEGEENERLRIAKELHDGVNVDLSAIKYKLTSLLEENNTVINEAVAMIDKSCQQVRAISHNLVPPALKDFSLIEAIEDYCSTMNNVHEPEIGFQYIGESIHIPKKSEISIFRIIQELVNNAVKHAKASDIQVQLSHRNHIIQITVEDNGTGFNNKIKTHDGIGLKNIQSRVAYLNAKLDFDSGEQGTSYIIEIDTKQLS